MASQYKNICVYLDMMGIKHANSGYRYLAKAIEIGLEYPAEVKKITFVYGKIGNLFGTSANNVERAIRYAIEQTRLTNKEFIMSAIDNIDFSSGLTQIDYIRPPQTGVPVKVRLKRISSAQTF